MSVKNQIHRISSNFSVKFVNHKYLMYRFFFIWTGFEKLIEFHVTFFQNTYISLKQTKLVLIDMSLLNFISHSAVLKIHENEWTLQAHYTFFSWISRVHNSEIMYKIQVMRN